MNANFYASQLYTQTDILLNKAEQLKGSINKTQLNSQNRDQEIQKVGSEFESLFLAQLLKSMRKTVPKSGFLGGGGWIEDFYWDMFDQGLSQSIARGGGIGLAKMVYQQMNRTNPSTITSEIDTKKN